MQKSSHIKSPLTCILLILAKSSKTSSTKNNQLILDEEDYRDQRKQNKKRHKVALYGKSRDLSAIFNIFAPLAETW